MCNCTLHKYRVFSAYLIVGASNPDIAETMFFIQAAGCCVAGTHFNTTRAGSRTSGTLQACFKEPVCNAAAPVLRVYSQPVDRTFINNNSCKAEAQYPAGSMIDCDEIQCTGCCEFLNECAFKPGINKTEPVNPADIFNMF
jgi:hypothetical protein